MNTTTETLPRSNRDYVEPAELRSLLKANLGYNARQVTVSARHSIRYLTITVRDPQVDLAAVEAFAATLDTWTMDNTDYCEGQSIRVTTTGEVDAAHAAPFVDEVRGIVSQLEAGRGAKLSNGKMLWHVDGEFYVSANAGTNRGCYVRASDVRSGAD